MKIKNCPKCDRSDVQQRDCGYSAFNPIWCVCKKCGFRIEGPSLVWNKKVVAMTGKARISKKKQYLANALARLCSEEELLKLITGKGNQWK